jgi:septum site-determining protein MinD
MVSFVVTGRGGAGKTTITANLGAYFAGLGYSTLLVDGDVYLPKLAFHFGMDHAPVTLHDILRDPRVGVREALYHDRFTGVDLVPGSSNIYDVLNTDQSDLRRVVSELQGGYQFTIIDSPVGIPFDTIPTFRLANYQLIVIELERSPIHSLDRMVENEVGKLKALGEAYGLKVGVVINKARESLGDIAWVVDYLEREMGVPVVGEIPYDVKVPEAVNYGEPLIKLWPKGGASKAISDMGEVLEEWTMGGVRRRLSTWGKLRALLSSLFGTPLPKKL